MVVTYDHLHRKSESSFSQEECIIPYSRRWVKERHELDPGLERWGWWKIPHGGNCRSKCREAERSRPCHRGNRGREGSGEGPLNPAEHEQGWTDSCPGKK